MDIGTSKKLCWMGKGKNGREGGEEAKRRRNVEIGNHTLAQDELRVRGPGVLKGCPILLGGVLVACAWSWSCKATRG